MKVTVLSPQKELYNGDAIRVKVPGKAGRFEVLKNHAPLVSSLEEGVVLVDSGSSKEEFQIKAGFIEVLRNEVSILIQQ